MTTHGPLPREWEVPTYPEDLYRELAEDDLRSLAQGVPMQALGKAAQIIILAPVLTGGALVAGWVAWQAFTWFWGALT
ncbi:MAG TPA: hypothetical protein VJP59_03380 [Gemmatimonadota bacterium]|nr:hypothetical protein [Gemmatimonadota bacterium]